MDDLARRLDYDADELLEEIPETFNPEMESVTKLKKGWVVEVPVDTEGAMDVSLDLMPPQEITDQQASALGHRRAWIVARNSGLKDLLEQQIAQNKAQLARLDGWYGPILEEWARDKVERQPVVSKGRATRQHLTPYGIKVTLRKRPEKLEEHTTLDAVRYQRKHPEEDLIRRKVSFDRPLTLEEWDELNEAMPESLQGIFTGKLEVVAATAKRLLKEGVKITGLELRTDRGDTVKFEGVP